MALDVSKWLKDNMAKLNLPDEDRAVAERLLSGSLGSALGAAVYPQEAVSGLQSALDKQKAEADRQITEYKTANQQWAEFAWGLGTKYNAVEELAAAGFDVTGLTAAPGGGVRNERGQQMTPAEIAELIRTEAAKAIEPARQATLDFAEFMPEAIHAYSQIAPGKKFEAKKFRAFAYEHRADYANLDQAFEAFTADERKAKAEADQKQWEAEKEKEIELRVMSRMSIPEAAGAEGGGVFDIAKTAPAAAPLSRDEMRQEFARKHGSINLQGL